jgi:hypothetical protein
MSNMQLSPDKSLLAYITHDRIEVSDFSATEEVGGTVLHSITHTALISASLSVRTVGSMIWSPDNKHLLFLIDNYEVWGWNLETDTWSKRLDYSTLILDGATRGKIHHCAVYDITTNKIICRVRTDLEKSMFFTFDLASDGDRTSTIQQWGPPTIHKPPISYAYQSEDYLAFTVCVLDPPNTGRIIVSGVSNPSDNAKSVFAAMEQEILYNVGTGISPPGVSELTYITNNGAAVAIIPMNQPIDTAKGYLIKDLALDSKETLYVIDNQNGLTAWDQPYTTVKQYYQDTSLFYSLYTSAVSGEWFHSIDIWTRDRMVVLYVKKNQNAAQISQVHLWVQCSGCRNAQTSLPGSTGADACKCSTGQYGSGTVDCTTCANGDTCAIGIHPKPSTLTPQP